MIVEEFARANPADFAPPLAVASVLAGFGRPWLLAGGWAIDLFLGRLTRPHGDVEIALARADQHALRAFLTGWTFAYVPNGAGSGYRQWTAGDWLAPPVHELYARRPTGEPTDLEVLLEEIDGDRWRYRRDRRLKRPWAEVGWCSSLGIPCVRPEVVLLYKAKGPRAIDEYDFAQVLPALDATARDWLSTALAQCHPGHPWLTPLRKASE